MDTQIIGEILAFDLAKTKAIEMFDESGYEEQQTLSAKQVDVIKACLKEWLDEKRHEFALELIASRQ